MKSNKKLKNNNKNTKIIKENINLDNLKSNYRLSIIFNNLRRKRLLELVKYNKKMQNRLNLSIKDYEILAIEVEIIPCKKKYGILLILKKMINYIIIYILMIIKKK